MSPRICVIGSINTDLTIRAPRLPAPGETVSGGGFTSSPGGKGANQAVAAARLGAEVDLVGRVGRDGHGDTLRTILHEERVGIEHVGVDECEPTGIALITVMDGGENTIVLAPGANAMLRREHVERAAPVIREADILMVQFEIPIETVLAAAQAARAVGVPVLLNAAPARVLTAALGMLVDVLVVNRGEGAVVAQCAAALPPDDVADLIRGSGPEGGPRSIVITLGRDGAVGRDASGAFAVAAPRVDAIDTVGAGDAFCGALAIRLAEGADLREAVPFACAAGAAATTRRGAIAGLPRRDQFE